MTPVHFVRSFFWTDTSGSDITRCCLFWTVLILIRHDTTSSMYSFCIQTDVLCISHLCTFDDTILYVLLDLCICTAMPMWSDVFYQYISDALSVMLYIFLITAFLDGVYLLPVLDTCADVVALMIMTSPGPSPGPGRYSESAYSHLDKRSST